MAKAADYAGGLVSEGRDPVLVARRPCGCVSLLLADAPHTGGAKRREFHDIAAYRGCFVERVPAGTEYGDPCGSPGCDQRF